MSNETQNDNSTVLLLLVGYRAVGKTTLCLHALDQGIPLFGKHWKQRFLQLSAPSKLPEWDSPPTRLLEQNSWFCENHLPFLSSLETLPATLLLHLDLVTLIERGDELCPHSQGQPWVSPPRSLSSLINDSDNERVFRHFLSNRFFHRFDHVVINTLLAPLERIAAQWSARQQQVPDRTQALYGDHRSPICRELHGSLYRSWLAAGMGALQPDQSQLIHFESGRLTIKRHHPG